MPPKRGAKKGKAAKSAKAAKKAVAEPTVEDQPMSLDEAVLPAPVIVNTESAGSDTILDNGPTTTDVMEQVEHKNGSIQEKAAAIASGEQDSAKVGDVVTAETESEAMAMEEEVDRVDSRALSKSCDDKEHGGRSEEANKMTMEERKAKFNELRKKMAASSKANRASLVEEAAKAKITARDAARLERQRKLAEILRTKADAEERGEDVERQKNWEYTIEENDEWEKKLARKRRRADFEFHDDSHAARRKYKKDLDYIKPDLEAYNKQKALAMGSGTLTAFNTSGSGMTVASEEQRMAAENLYRDANTLIYGDNKPSEDAIDLVVGKINKDIDKKSRFSRKRNEDEGDITYINEHNRVFNKKIARYYDKYTAEIRASFERGTAL